MRNSVSILLMLVLTAMTIRAQTNQLRKISNKRSQDTYYSQDSGNQATSLRIENSKVWVQGNLIANKDLPESLQHLNPNVFYQAAVFGVKDITFALGSHEYIVSEGKVIEVPSRVENQESSKDLDLSTKEAYYSQLKRESPGLFYNLSREGALYERCRSLLLEYQLAEGKVKDKVRDEIRMVLGQLFDINEHNRGLEIQQLEQMIDAAKMEVEFRNRNKSGIIDQTLTDLLQD